LVLKVPLVLQVLKVLLEHKDLQGLKVQLVQQDQQVLKAQQAHRVLKEVQVLKDL
jgi:hypothetical protein